MSLYPYRAITSLVVIAVLAFPALMGARPSGAEDEVPLVENARVDPERELMITDPSVIAAPLETTFDQEHPSGDARRGAWTFGRLVHNMLPEGKRNSPKAASKLVMNWLKTWEVDQSPNPGISPAFARSGVRVLILDPWKFASGCDLPESPTTDAACVLDMSVAPFKLMAIVNRPDLRIVANDSSAIGGEGRFVFQVHGPTLAVKASGGGGLGVMDPTVTASKFTVIFEYSLPVWSTRDTLAWAREWHQLGRKPFGREYNAALRELTEAFSGAGSDPRRVNGNALNQIRTNEVSSQGARFFTNPASPAPPVWASGTGVWELREFRLASGGIVPHTVNLEPSRDFDIARPVIQGLGQVGLEGTRPGELSAFLQQNGPAVLAGSYKLPRGMSGNSALVAGRSPHISWGKDAPIAPAIAAPGQPNQLGADIDVRDKFALTTCAGCHRHETDTRHFMHITALGAMEPNRATPLIEDRTAAGVIEGTPEDAIVLSNALRADISPGGGRHEDFKALLAMTPRDLRNKPGIRVCAQ
jgi:hypothetical protein